MGFFAFLTLSNTQQPAARVGLSAKTMSPLGTQYYTVGTNVPIHAYHSEGYVFDHRYTSDNNKASLASTDWPDTYVHMLGSGATVYPVFTPVPTYPTTVNAYVTWDGYNYEYYGTSTPYAPAGSNYLSFGSLFVQAYNYYDSSTHYSDPDWYDLGTGTTIDVYYDLSG